LTDANRARHSAANRSVLCLDGAPPLPASVWFAIDTDGSSLWSAMGCSGLDGSENCHQEVGILTPRTKVPRGQKQVSLQPRLAGVGQERRELVATVGPEADDDPSLRMKVPSEASHHLNASARREERHHVSGADDGIEGLRNTSRRQVKLRQVLDDPARTG
jgi:hypothetical protein